MAMRTRALLALAIFAALLSFTKFSHCQATNWATPDQYIHACYSDLPSLFGERGMVDNHMQVIPTQLNTQYLLD
jgi:hypothetical protein